MGIAENLTRLRKEIPGKVKIIVVSKTRSVSEIREAYDTGHRDFGENKAQELSEKQKQLPADISWHMIGHLQTNKVRLIAPFVSLIQSVDSMKLLSVINSEGTKNQRQIDCLLQMRIATEETKSGMTWEEAVQILKSSEFQAFRNIRIIGLMGMSTFTENMEQVKLEFLQLANYFDYIRKNFFNGNPAFRELSIGMSGDYIIALETGSTMVRIGTLIFGERDYSK